MGRVRLAHKNGQATGWPIFNSSQNRRVWVSSTNFWPILPCLDLAKKREIVCEDVKLPFNQLKSHDLISSQLQLDRLKECGSAHDESLRTSQIVESVRPKLVTD